LHDTFLMYIFDCMEVERLKEHLYPEQVTIKVSKETKRKLEWLKEEKSINTSAELRKAIERIIPQLEQAG